MLLSPGLPRLPGGLEPQPPAEPPLTHEEFAPRPPPLPCKPLPPEIVAQIAAGQGMQAALEGWRKKSQLAWCLEQMRREEEEAAAAEAAAARQQVRVAVLSCRVLTPLLRDNGQPALHACAVYPCLLPRCCHVRCRPTCRPYAHRLSGLHGPPAGLPLTPPRQLPSAATAAAGTRRLCLPMPMNCSASTAVPLPCSR